MSDLRVAQLRQIIACAALAFAVLLLSVPTIIYLFRPVSGAAGSDIVLPTAEAVNTLRTAFGGLHLGPMLIAAIGLFVPRYRQPALLFLVVLMVSVAGTRWIGIAMEGLTPRFAAWLEMLGLVVYSLGLWAVDPFNASVADE